MIAALLSETVESLGHSVCAIAATEATAVVEALTCQPDLMIVDAGLSEGSGVSAVDTILETCFVPHLFVTGDVRRVRAQHPDAMILEKPFLVHELACAIDRIALTVPSPVVAPA